ncbi:MAG: hypothetical protein P1U70_17640 [Saprospiraceae bacterium]|nr:hypothetical protein [Saprospiraceae bacterium]
MEKTNYKLAILVVFYNKDLISIASLDLLEKLLSNNKSISLVLWNNGPKIVSSKIFDGDVNLIQTIENLSLSYIYNYFINENTAEKYLFLDDDTIIDNQFIHSVLNYSFEIGLPKIYDNKCLSYPKVNGKVIDCDVGCFVNSEMLTSIGSGLVISRNAVSRMKHIYDNVFDERFRFYGVDTSFYFRLSNRLLNFNEIKILPFISHSLSKNLKESNKVKEFRRIERSLDIALTLKYYRNNISVLRILSSVLYDKLKSFIGLKNSLYSLKIIFLVYFHGKYEKKR